MKIILSPAKKMKSDPEGPDYQDLPRYLEQSRRILDWMRARSHEELKRLWGCNDKIAEENFRRLDEMDLKKNLTPAILAYEGIAYQYMAPTVFENGEFDYVQEHLRILSAFYGVLKPMDGVTPYRLEMGSRFGKLTGPVMKVAETGARTDETVKTAETGARTDEAAIAFTAKSLYDFWDSRLYEAVRDDSGIIINLASKEYSKAVEKYLGKADRYITITFCEKVKGKLVTKGTYAKMARGDMVRFMAEGDVEDPEELKKYDRMGYVFRPQFSTESEFVFERISEESDT